MNSLITKNKSALELLFKKHKVVKAALFGSALSNKFNDESDIDILISFQEGLDPVENGELWWSLYENLKQLLGKEIDLITERSLKNPFFISEIEKTKQPIYG